MKTLVIDANIVVKWIFPDSQKEPHLPQAIHLLKAIKEDVINVLQPPHWLVEVIAVVARLESKVAEDAINFLHAMEFSTIESVEIFHTASSLSAKYKHHLFDTLYHAVALHHRNAKFITADDKYFHKVYKEGSIVRLSTYSIFDD